MLPDLHGCAAIGAMLSDEVGDDLDASGMKQNPGVLDARILACKADYIG